MTAPRDAVGEIRRIYFSTTRSTITRDLERAIALLKSLPSEEARQAAAGYMDGLAQLRSEWNAGASAAAPPPGRRPPARPRRG